MTTKSGWLVKEGAIVKSWNRRWFTLRDGFLSYSQTEESKKLGNIDLRKAGKILPIAYKEKKNCFSLEIPDRTYYLVADTTEDMDEWIEALRFSRVHYHPSVTTEGENPNYYRAWLKVTLVRATGLPAADENGLSDPFVEFNLGPNSLKSNTKPETLDPVWEESFVRSVEWCDNVVTFQIYDEDEHQNEFLGSCQVDWRTLGLQVHQSKQLTCTVLDEKQVDNGGRLIVRFEAMAEPPTESEYNTEMIRQDLEEIRKQKLSEQSQDQEIDKWVNYLDSVTLNPSNQIKLSEPEIDSVLKGHFRENYYLSSGLVRLFTSSTFTDTKEERNFLMENVYPRLRQLCQKFGHEFTVVDMRWGVRDESTEDHLTSFLCMRELKRCKDLSVGPNFVTFVGDKYGYRPFPPKIDKSEFDQLVTYLEQQGEDTSIINKWFYEDNNNVPPQRVLQKISSILPNYNSTVVSERKTARSEWWNCFETMQRQFRKASVALTDERRRDAYIISVTEEEIHNGIIYAEDLENTYCFRRTITNIDQSSSIASNFIDMEWSTGAPKIDQDAQVNLKELKTSKLPRRYGNANLTGHIRDYTVDWGKGWIDLEGNTKHKEYFESFINDFQEAMSTSIISGIEKVTWAVPNLVYQETASHLKVIEEEVKYFEGYEEFIENICSYASDYSCRHPLIVHGPPGSGKTGILAKSAEKIREQLPEQGYVITRFMGRSGESSSARAVATNITQLIWQVKNSNEDITQCPISGDWEKLKNEQWNSFLKASSDKPIVLILDSLDSLRSDEDVQFIDLFPLELREYIHIILSVTTDNRFHNALKAKFKNDQCYLEIPKIEHSHAISIFEKYMSHHNRTLNDEQFDIISKSLEKSPNPLYVRLLIDISLRWTSYQDISKDDVPPTIDSSIESIFARLEYYHGNLFTSHALSYVTIGKNGTTESELEDMLSLDDECLDDIYQYWEPPIRRLPPLLWTRLHMDIEEFLIERGAFGFLVYDWFHLQFREVVYKRYVSNGDILKQRHSHMGNYFSGIWSKSKPHFNKKRNRIIESNRRINPQKTIFKEDSNQQAKTVFNVRKVAELPHHLGKAVMEKEFESILLDPTFIRASFRCGQFFELLKEAVNFKAQGHGSSKFQTVIGFLEEQSKKISDDPSFLYSPNSQKEMLLEMGKSFVMNTFTPQNVQKAIKFFQA